MIKWERGKLAEFTSPAPIKHFKPTEFECGCGKCKEQTIEYTLLVKLDALRSALKQPIRINSGFRCESHNKIVGGEPNSQHLVGFAADIVVSGYSDDDYIRLLIMARTYNFTGFGLYNGRIHLDVRGSYPMDLYFWDKRYGKL